MISLIISSLILIGLDQTIKMIITMNLELDSSIKIIDNFFSLSNVHNYGAAWSILNDQIYILIIIAFVALIVIYQIFIKNKLLSKFDIILLAMLISGIIGNLIDRIFRGYVIDYLDFNIFGYNFPVFNLADSLIVISAFILFIKSFKEEKHGKV